MDAKNSGCILRKHERQMTQSELAENRKRKDRQQEKQIIIVTELISVFILLIDQIGCSVENIWFTGTGVVLPVMFFYLFLFALFGFPGQN